MRKRHLLSLLTLAAVGLAGLRSARPARSATTPPGEAQLNRMTARFAPVEIGADVSSLPAQERRALAHMIEAARLMDTIFLRQVWQGNAPLLLDLAQDRTPLGA